MKQILVVEDNLQIKQLICEALEKEQYTVYEATNAIDGLKIFQSNTIDCILTDLMLPLMSGEEFIEEIRETSDVYIIVISAKTNVSDKLEGLRKGADDYLYKPFVTEEIIIKLNRLFKKKDNEPNIISLNNKEFLLKEHQVSLFVKGKTIELTSIEYRMVEYMFHHINQVISRDTFLDVLYQYNADVYDRVVDVHIKNIRKKIKQITDTILIETVYGLGYKVVGEKDEVTS